MSEIKLGSHVGMSGKEMFLGSVKEAASYGANVLMLYTGAPQNTRRKEIADLNIDAGWEYAGKAGIKEIVVHAPYIINLANINSCKFQKFLSNRLMRRKYMRISPYSPCKIRYTELAQPILIHHAIRCASGNNQHYWKHPLRILKCCSQHGKLILL